MLQYSEYCLNFKQVPAHHWIFELIAIYQTVKFVSKELYQLWQFSKLDQELVILCLNDKGEVLQGLSMDISVHRDEFNSLPPAISFVLYDHQCMLEEEFVILAKMSA